HCQPCHGQTSLSPSIIPCPSGPPRCRQTLSMAEIVPFTLATQIVLSPQGNSLASPSGGSSDWVVSLVKLDMAFVPRDRNCRALLGWTAEAAVPTLFPC